MTEGLDPTTQRAVEILTAADVMASGERRSPSRSPRRWSEPGWWMAMLLFLGIGLLAWGQFQQQDTNDRLARVLTRIQHIQKVNHTLLAEVRSCTTPSGKCAKRGADSQTQAINVITNGTAMVVCVALHPQDPVAATQCTRLTIQAVTAANRQ